MSILRRQACDPLAVPQAPIGLGAHLNVVDDVVVGPEVLRLVPQDVDEQRVGLGGVGQLSVPDGTKEGDE
eukprot:scaffold252168_cov38-Prasinocladus_malaysianus.AAC.1